MNSKLIITLAVTLAAVILVCLVIQVLAANKTLGLSTYVVSGDEIPTAFDGFRIAQVSDFHNSDMGDSVLEMLAEAKPDIIVITGDLIDSRNTDMGVALDFAREAVKIAPCYFVAGNHESRIAEYADLVQGLTELGVTVLEGESIEIESGTDKITLVGVSDPTFVEESFSADYEGIMREKLGELDFDNGYTVLLSHRPELIEAYSEVGADLVFSGHAHGGQFRLPVIGGLFAPDQGFFPKYDAGVVTFCNTTMVISRGIGKSIIPIRINNNPELVLAELRIGSGS